MHLVLRIREYPPKTADNTVPPPCDVWLLRGKGITCCLLHGKMFKEDAEALAKKLGKAVTVERESVTLPDAFVAASEAAKGEQS